MWFRVALTRDKNSLAHTHTLKLLTLAGSNVHTHLTLSHTHTHNLTHHTHTTHSGWQQCTHSPHSLTHSHSQPHSLTHSHSHSQPHSPHTHHSLWLAAVYTLFCLLQVRELAELINPGLEVVTCGSYRRGKPTCGDVDILVTHSDGRLHRGVLPQLVQGGRECGE